MNIERLKRRLSQIELPKDVSDQLDELMSIYFSADMVCKAFSSPYSSAKDKAARIEMLTKAVGYSAVSQKQAT